MSLKNNLRMILGSNQEVLRILRLSKKFAILIKYKCALKHVLRSVPLSLQF